MATEDDLRATLETLEAALYRKTYGGQIWYFEPYAKQREFFDAGAAHRERLLIAGNQNGKCISARTPVDHPDGTSTHAGVLFGLGREFPVLAWDGERVVPAQATWAIMKPPEPMVRVTMEDGRWFECALDHRVLTPEGYDFVGCLLESAASHLLSTSAPGRSTRASDARRWFEKASGWLDRCLDDLRLCGGRPLIEAAAGLACPPSPCGARRHTLSFGHWDAQASTGANSPSEVRGRPPSLDDLARTVDPFGGSLDRSARSSARRTIATLRAAQRIFAVEGARLRSCDAGELGRSFWPALLRPGSCAGNKIVSYHLISSETVYDFTVPIFHNYLAAGVVHHNTHAGGYEAALHLTGEYPDWWKGRRFDKPTKGWIAGETSLAVRDIQQKKLCGEPGVEEAFGSGMIPKAAFSDKPSLARGVTDAYDTIQVRHKSGGVSIGRFKSYEQGRAKFQGESLDWLWFDEEPPQDVYSEGLTRTVATRGMAFMTFTPLKGRSSVVLRFLDEPSPDRSVTTMTIDDALHIAPEERQRIINGYLPHEREARARGVPILGSGRIFMTSEEQILEPPLEYIPAHWKKLWGIDFGIGHPFAAVLGLWDVDNDVIHIHQTIRMADALVMAHAAAMKRVGAGVPVAWPLDGTERDRDSGEPLAQTYRRHGLRMLHQHAQWEDGGRSTEAGIIEWDDREKTGRLKVARQLADWLEERRFYHRKDGRIVKLKDDLMSATRMVLMAKRFAKAVALGPVGARAQMDFGQPADGVDFDVFTGA